jgi:hypothetical protein
MSIEVQNEQATIEEAVAILLERMPASKVARLLCAWQAGRGNYMSWRDTTFAKETVDGLYEKAKALRKAT